MARPVFIFRSLNGINVVVFLGDSFHDSRSQLLILSLTLAMVQNPGWHELSCGRSFRLHILESLGRLSSWEK